MQKACVVILFLLIQACAVTPDSNPALLMRADYQAEILAKNWHEQVKKNPHNPYDARNLPGDNDRDYQYQAYYKNKHRMDRPVSVETAGRYMQQHSKDERAALRDKYMISGQGDEAEYAEHSE